MAPLSGRTRRVDIWEGLTQEQGALDDQSGSPQSRSAQGNGPVTAAGWDDDRFVSQRSIYIIAEWQ